MQNEILIKVNNRNRNSGFTLIELVIVLVIMGIAAGIVGIYIGSSSDNLALRTFTKDVSAILRYARNHAAAEKQSYCFVIDKEESMYRLYAHKEIENKDVIVINKSIPDSLEVIVEETGEEFYDIEFFPRGNSSGGSIEIRNENGRAYFILVNKITGKVEVEKAE